MGKRTNAEMITSFLAHAESARIQHPEREADYQQTMQRIERLEADARALGAEYLLLHIAHARMLLFAMNDPIAASQEVTAIRGELSEYRWRHDNDRHRGVKVAGAAAAGGRARAAMLSKAEQAPAMQAAVDEIAASNPRLSYEAIKHIAAQRHGWSARALKTHTKNPRRKLGGTPPPDQP